MTALAANKVVQSRVGMGALSRDLYLKAKASTTFYAGSHIVVDGTTGLAEPATAAASKFTAGVCLEKVVTGAGGGYVTVRRGVFKFLNKAGDLVTDALVLRDCYIEDDQTVRLTATGSSRAGKVIGVESDGVWVETY